MKEMSKACFSWVCVLMIFSYCINLCACGAAPVRVPALNSKATEQPVKKITIPNVKKMDVDTAKALLAEKGLIPKVEYEYSNDCDYDLVTRTDPFVGSQVEEDTPVTLYVCKGPSYYELTDAAGYMRNINNIDAFSWGDDGKPRTKGFYTPYVKEGYLYIPMYLKCTSKYSIEFYGDFGTAAVNDSFEKTIPVKVIYESEQVNNKGEKTEFEVKIPLSDLDVQRYTNIYIEFSFSVNSQREDFEAGFDLTW